MRISKYPPLCGLGIDRHGALPPIIPPPPPAGPNPAPIPTHTWIHTIVVPYTAAITGKWSMDSVQTEGMGDILWQYDWGPLQPHVPMPAILTPSIAVLLLGSTAKYWMASHAITEHVDGGALASGDAAVAVSLPIFIISGEDCWDTASALSFVLPSSVLSQAVSVRWVGFNFWDAVASAIAMAGDAVAALITSKFGGKFIPGSWDDQLLGGLASTGMMHAGNLLASLPPGFVLSGSGGLTAAVCWLANTSAGLVFLAPVVAMAAGQGGSWIGDNWGSDEHGVVQSDTADRGVELPPWARR